ncbi:MAG TPA: calcium-binding protein [Allosphingosinicella sp.]
MKKFVFAGAALAAIAAIPATAQPGPDGPARHDGPLTRASVQTMVQARFAKVDTNKDGFVTRAEADARMAEAREKREARMEQRRERRAENRAGLFDRIDTDKNGSISRTEFDAHSAARAERRAERRGPDGAKGGRGMRHGGMMRHRGAGAMAGGHFGGRMFERMDSDRDGKVSIAEASSRALEMFDRADSNRDGTVTVEERRAARERFREDRRGGDAPRGG